MIRKLHYCWFGGPVPNAVLDNVQRWKDLNPEFELIEWNENNIDVSAFEFGRRCLEQKKWGFLGDVVRLQALTEHGGFYLDCDIELVKPLSLLPVNHRFSLGYIYNCALGTAFLYAPPHHTVCMHLLDLFDQIKPDCWPVSNTVYTDYFINEIPGFLLNGKTWSNDLVAIYPKEFFEQPALIRSRGFSIHHCCGSWKPDNGSYFALNMRSSHQIKWLKRKINTAIALRKNEFYACYQAALKGISLKKEYEWRREKAPSPLSA
ncbi:glycosyltransferase [uncultured Akkermansia sp.]|uniref:glycosyltransferase family 32 protein n=1 Tax=uncultured Akkermansia sp. TaxID=512294 RepID=UPI00261C1119|nr:glycosyltransferase [uncultured Akkermansia sp.]